MIIESNHNNNNNNNNSNNIFVPIESTRKKSIEIFFHPITVALILLVAFLSVYYGHHKNTAIDFMGVFSLIPILEFNLGYCYYYGQGVSKDYAIAVEYSLVSLL